MPLIKEVVQEQRKVNTLYTKIFLFLFKKKKKIKNPQRRTNIRTINYNYFKVILKANTKHSELATVQRAFHVLINTILLATL